MPTPQDVARWMYDRFLDKGYLSQEVAVCQIAEIFGVEFVYTNNNGNLAIDRRVLAEFRKLSGAGSVWDRSEYAWRTRHPSDRPGRQQP